MDVLGWLKKRLAPALWRIEIEARVEYAEAQLADLRARFTRFQNRENLRQARAEKGGTDALADQVASLLGDPGAAKVDEVDEKQQKLALWRERH